MPWPKAFWRLDPCLCSLPVKPGVGDDVAFRHRLSNEHSKDSVCPAGQSQIVCSLLLVTALTLGQWQNSQLGNNHQTVVVFGFFLTIYCQRRYEVGSNSISVWYSVMYFPLKDQLWSHAWINSWEKLSFAHKQRIYDMDMDYYVNRIHA